MAKEFLFLCLWACSYAQLIYPDQYERMVTSTISPYPSQYRQSKVQTGMYRDSAQQPAASYAATQQPNFQYSQAYALAAAAAPSNANELAYTTQQSAVTENPLQQWDDHVNNIITRGITQFTLDIERQIYITRLTSQGLLAQRENIIFSPLSLSVALAMVLLGSAGRTFDEVSKILGLESGVDISQHSEVVHQMFGLLLSRVHNRLMNTDGPRIDSASGIFVQDGYPIRREFETVCKTAYHSEVINLDFARKPREAQTVINNWVNQKTMGKIPTLLNRAPDPFTTVILASALYFKGEWNQHFLDGATKRRPFKIEPNEALDVDMMYNGGVFPFYEDKQLGAKIISLPYKGLDTAMYVILPSANGANALRNFQSQLTPEILESLIGNLKNETCIVGMPRMKLSDTLSLSTALSNMGLYSLFDAQAADLSLLSPGYNSQTGAPSPASYAPTYATPTARPSSADNGQRPKIGSSQLTQNNDIFIFPRFGDDDRMVNSMRKHYFSYQDRIRGYTVRQWATGFSIKRTNRIRRQDAKDSAAPQKDSKVAQDKGNNHSYVVNDRKGVTESTRVVSLEKNKYRFQDEGAKQTRTKRQNRPMDEGFLRYIQAKNFTSYGLDELRNSANLFNPGLFASNVLHKVEIEINEKGTEAAAATAVLLERDGNQKRLIANRPFIFFIRHNPSKLLLFWGTINTPVPNYSVT